MAYIGNADISTNISIQTQVDNKLPLSGGTLTGDVSLGDNVKAKFGASNDLQIYHDGSNSYISDQGTGKLRLLASQFELRNPANTESMIFGAQDNYVTLYYDNSQKLSTTSTGVSVTGDIWAGGATFDGGTGYGKIEIGGTSGGFIDLKNPMSDDYDGRIICTGASLDVNTNAGVGPVRLGYEGAIKLQTTSTGVEVTGVISATSPTGTEIEVRSSDTLISTGDLIGGLKFRSDDTNGIPPHYSGIKAKAADTYGGASLEFYVGRDRYENNDPRVVIEGPQSVSGEAMRIDSNGNVGIGASNPSYKFEVLNNQGADFVLGEAVNTARSMRIRANDDTHSDPYSTQFFFSDHPTSNAGSLSFWSSKADERMRIDSSGNVGIGTSSPSAKLEVSSTNSEGRILLNGVDLPMITNDFDNFTSGTYNGAGRWGMFMEANTLTLGCKSGSGQFSFKHFNADSTSTERMKIYSNGNVGIFNNLDFVGGAATVRIHLSGGTPSSSNTGIAAAWNVHSDYRLKENVSEITDAIDTVKALRPINFSWIEEENDEATTGGFLAHELDEHIPYAVLGEKDAVNDDGDIISQAADYSKVVPILTAALQEAVARIEVLESQLGA